MLAPHTENMPPARSLCEHPKPLHRALCFLVRTHRAGIARLCSDSATGRRGVGVVLVHARALYVPVLRLRRAVCAHVSHAHRAPLSPGVRLSRYRSRGACFTRLFPHITSLALSRSRQNTGTRTHVPTPLHGDGCGRSSPRFRIFTQGRITPGCGGNFSHHQSKVRVSLLEHFTGNTQVIHR